MKTRKASFAQPAVMLTLFCLFTLLTAMVDFKPIGPRGSEVGLAAVNGYLHSHFGYNDLFYVLSKLLGYVCFLIPVINVGVAIRDIYRKKSLFRIGPDVLGAFCIYVLMAAAYLLFDTVILNYRPVLMDGQLEPSYPSSHTLMAVTLSLTAALQLNFRDRNLERKEKNQLILICLGILVVVTRFFSGVHWFTDIVGGILLALTLTALYVPLVRLIGRLFYKDKKGGKKTGGRPRQGHGAKPHERHVKKEEALEEEGSVWEILSPGETGTEAAPPEKAEAPAPKKEGPVRESLPEAGEEAPAAPEKEEEAGTGPAEEKPAEEKPAEEKPAEEKTAEEKKEVPEE